VSVTNQTPPPKAHFSVPGGLIAALDTMPAPTAGVPTALLVPGYTGSKEDFAPLLTPLTQAGYRVVAIDQRGQYESSWAEDEAGYRIESLGDDLRRVAESLRPAATALHLVGHSFGGLVGRAAVLAAPELFDSFTLMSSGPAALQGPRRQLIDEGEQVLAERGMAGLWQEMAARAQADPATAQAPAQLLEFLQARFMGNDPVGLQVMGDQLRTVVDLTDKLKGCGLPLLVLHGVDDDTWPPTAQAEMAVRLGAEHVVIPAAAHSPAVENTADTAAALLAFFSGGA